MAVSSATSWADTTEISASATAARLKAVVFTPISGAAGEVFIQLWDVANPTPGTTAPRHVIAVPIFTGVPRRRKVIFPGGFPFATALTWFVSTTHDGATAATTDAPSVVDIYFEPI